MAHNNKMRIKHLVLLVIFLLIFLIISDINVRLFGNILPSSLVPDSLALETIVKVSANPRKLPADDRYKSKITARVSPRKEGENVDFSASMGSLSFSSCLTDSRGRCFVYLTSDDAGTSEVSVLIPGYGSASSSVKFTPKSIKTSASPRKRLADGEHKSKITAKIFPRREGVNVDFSTNLGSLSSSSCLTDRMGRCFVYLISNEGGMATLSTMAHSYGSAGATVELTPSLLAPKIKNNTARYIVKFKSSYNVSKYGSNEINALYGVEKIKDLKFTDATILNATVEQIDNLKNNPDVEYVGKDALVIPLADTIPWNVGRVGAPKVWDYGNTGQGIKVTIIDSGIDYNHPDLAANFAGGIDLGDGDNDPMDGGYHGTLVAGVIAASYNGFGIAGVAPGAKIYAVKILNKQGDMYLSDVIDGIRWAIDNKVNIISISLAMGPDYLLEQAVNDAYNAGIVVVAAAGNCNYGCTVITWPAAYDSVIAVGGTMPDNGFAGYSYGPKLELVAPAASVITTQRKDFPDVYNLGLGPGYTMAAGTSLATPHISGVVALLLNTQIPINYDINNNGKWDPAEARKILQDTAIDFGSPGKDIFYGYGIVNASAANIACVDLSNNFRETIMKFDTDNSRTISREEAIKATVDFFDNLITREEAVAVTKFFFEGCILSR